MSFAASVVRADVEPAMRTGIMTARVTPAVASSMVVSSVGRTSIQDASEQGAARIAVAFRQRGFFASQRNPPAPIARSNDDQA